MISFATLTLATVKQHRNLNLPLTFTFLYRKEGKREAGRTITLLKVQAKEYFSANGLLLVCRR